MKYEKEIKTEKMKAHVGIRRKELLFLIHRIGNERVEGENT